MAADPITSPRRSSPTRKKLPSSEPLSRLSSVQRLLETGFLQGLRVTCFSEERGAEVPGVIKGSGFLCGCSRCNYKNEVLSGKVFEEHAGANTKFQTDHIFFSNRINMYEVLQVVKNVPEDELLVKILKLRMDMKGEKFYEEPPWVPIMSSAGKRAKMKISDEIASVSDNRAKAVRTFIHNDSDKEKLSAVPDLLLNTFGASRQFKFYTRYNPERRLLDVRGLLSTGLLEGFRVTYKKNEARLEALIRGSAYECGCSSCNYAKVVTAKELEAHAGEFSKNPNENIYVASEITLYKLVNELKGTPLYLLGNFLQEKIKCSPNYSSFEIWKGSYKMGGGFQNLRPNFDGELEVNSKCCSVQRKSRNVGSTDSTSDTSLVRDMRNTPGSTVCNGSLNFVGDEEHSGSASRKTRSPRINKFKKSSFGCDVVRTLLMGGVQKHDHEFSGSECTRTSNVTYSDIEDPDYSPLDNTSKGLTDEKRSPSRRILKTREKYENVQNSDGKILHELSSELRDIPRSSSGGPFPRHGKRHQNNHHKRIAKPLLNTTQDFVVSTRLGLKRVLQSQKGVLVHCTICKERCAALGDEVDPKLIIFCNQCDRAYHVGCLKDQESFKMKDVLNGSWFCCTDCTWVHNCFTNICALSAMPVPDQLLDLLKRSHAAVNNRLNLCWQVLGGGNTEDQMLLSQALKFIKGAFRPILHGKKDIIQQMVFGKQVAGTGQDFRGVLCVVIKLDEEIVSIAVLRVFGKFIAEIPLATSSKLWRQKGYFHVLLSLIEELLSLLQVRLLVAPVHEKMEAIWIHKLGFIKTSDEKVQLLKEQHGLILFEDTALLEKKIRVATD